MTATCDSAKQLQSPIGKAFDSRKICNTYYVFTILIFSLKASVQHITQSFHGPWPLLIHEQHSSEWVAREGQIACIAEQGP